MLTKRAIPVVAVAISLAGGPARMASASGFRLASQDAFATGRGEAFVATADNASAVYYNPAGLTQLEGLNVRGGAYGIYFDPTYTPPSPGDTHKFHIDHQLAVVPQFFAAYTPEDWPLSFGLGTYAPFGGNIDWPQNTGFRAVAISGELTYVTINPVLAIKLPAGFSIAGGATFNYAEMQLEQGINASAAPLLNFFRFQGQGWSAGYNLGLLWHLYEPVSVGATFRSSVPFTLEGHSDFEVQPFIHANERSAQVDFEFPLTAVVGISYRPTPKWNFEFDADYTDWSSFGQTTLYQSLPATPFPITQNIPMNFDWQPSWMYEVGATRYFDNGWHVSGGFVYSENSVPDAFYSPLAADMDRYFVCLGAGFKKQHFSCDLAYQVGWGPTHTVTGSTPTAKPTLLDSGQRANGAYDYISNAILLTVGWHF
jgi:long-chain fatty acid transport protein